MWLVTATAIEASPEHFFPLKEPADLAKLAHLKANVECLELEAKIHSLHEIQERERNLKDLQLQNVQEDIEA